MYKLLLGLGIVSLYGSFTNVVPVSALICTFFFVVPFILYYRGKTDKIIFYAIMLLGYFLLSVLVYDYHSLFTYEFYRYDGNAFISMMPLLILGSIKHNWSVKKIIIIFIYIVTVVNFIFMIIYGMTGGTFVATEEGVYHFLFKAHNAAGGFLMIVTALCFGLCMVDRKIKYMLCLLMNLLGLILTDSRGSMLGLLIGLTALGCIKKNWLKCMVGVACVVQIVVYGSAYYLAPENFMDVNLMTVDSVDLDDTMQRGGTFINRFFYLWPRAVYLFLQSPILGTGFGSYDDWPYNLYNVFCFAINESINIHSDFHAHNSYLNLLAETGFVGLMLFIAYVRQIHIRLICLIQTDREIAYMLIICLWAALASAMTEHRIFTPAQMLPFYTILGLLMSRNKNNKTEG